MRTKTWVAAIAATAIGLSISGQANAEVIIDPDSGIGFVGKGDVQLFYGWSNKEVNAQAANVTFHTQIQQKTDHTWSCLNSNNDKTNERDKTTTTIEKSVITTVTRENKSKQVTGFKLTGFSATTTNSESSNGQAPGTCPVGSTLVAGSYEIDEEAPVLLALKISLDGGKTTVTFWEPPAPVAP
jgi:hypothetical protein